MLPIVHAILLNHKMIIPIGYVHYSFDNPCLILVTFSKIFLPLHNPKRY